MGTASRTKRERRERERAQPAMERPVRRGLRVFWIVVGLLVVGGLVTFIATRPDDSDRAADRAWQAAPVYADVDASESLAVFPGNDKKDPAVGSSMPTLSGTGTDGKPLTYAPTDGAQVLVVFAHWRPHCNAEVPKIMNWATSGHLPAEVQLRGVSTAARKDLPNFPPAQWLSKEHWSYDALIDDEVGAAAEALGGDGFPFIVFVDADGKVQRRFSREMDIKAFNAAAQKLAGPDIKI